MFIIKFNETLFFESITYNFKEDKYIIRLTKEICRIFSSKEECDKVHNEILNLGHSCIVEEYKLVSSYRARLKNV